jgi:OHCU decarboxylase
MRYPRDLIGYGQEPPRPKWPGNANIAVQFVLNYEEGGENCVLHGDPASEAFLSEIVGAVPWPNQRHWNMESIYEYGARSGFWRLHRLFTRGKIPVTVFGVASALARSPEQVAAMKEANWEIASHGLKWIDYKDVSEDEEATHFKAAMAIHESVTGTLPRGWYLGRCSENSVKIASQYGNFAYISDSYSDDLPFWVTHNSKNQLIIPYTLDANDMRFATPQGFNSGAQFYEYLRDTFDILLQEGRDGQPKMMTVGLHCRLIGRPGRIMALSRFIDYIKAFQDIWIAKRIEIAEHWIKHHPCKTPDVVPYNLEKKSFLSIFGNVFENSCWIAERAFEKEVSPTMNTAVGLHAALCLQFRLASREEKLNVLREHPDLAGKLSLTKKLTKESEQEQKSAGLNNLTERDLVEFNELNDSYTAKFKHPFIMAVSGSSKEKILQSFRNRIQNSPEDELKKACEQVEKIALIRVKEILKN